jgi:hypothetical protein
LILFPSIYYLITCFYEKLIIGLLYMPGLEIQSTGEIVATYNGDVVEDAKWNMDYDGETMDIETMRNNELAIIQLDNNDLSRLLQGIGMHRENGLEDRLQRDFMKKKSTSCGKTKRVRFMDDNLRKSGKQKHKIIIRKQGSRQGSAPARRSKRRRSSPRSKRSSPRSSPRSKRSSPKRSSPKRSSPRSSPKRSSPKRSSPRSSPKRSSPRSSPKRRRSSVNKKKSSNRKTRKRSLQKGENVDIDLDFDYDFNSRPDIEKTIY